MSTRIDNPGPQIPSSSTTNQSVGDVTPNTSSSSFTPATGRHEEDPHSDAKTAGALKQSGTEMKSQHDMAARLVKMGLEKQVSDAPNRVVIKDKFPELAKIHVQRQVETTPPQTKKILHYVGESKTPDVLEGSTSSGKEVVKTKFPNGVGFNTESSIEPDGKRIVSAVSIEGPPGGKTVPTKDGTIILDANGKEIGKSTVSIDEKNGTVTATLNVYTKEGEYVQNPDGSVAFTPKPKK